MPSQSEIESVAAALLATKDLRLVSCRTLQSLWAGYGQICHITAAPSATPNKGTQDQPNQPTTTSFVLKYITPPLHPTTPHDEGHIRKLLSYQVELAFYTLLAPHLPPDVAVATCHASTSHSQPSFKTALLLTDLRPAFPVVAAGSRATLSESQVAAAVRWLAGFHGFWWRRCAGGDEDGRGGLLDRGTMVRPPLVHLREHGNAVVGAAEGERAARVWLNGGYTYLATRREEYAALCAEEGAEWAGALGRVVGGVGGASVAEVVARALAPKEKQPGGGGGSSGGLDGYETLIHGDVKSENLFANAAGDKVAFFDFQYVGLGFGVCDLAKLFTCSVPRAMLGEMAGARQARLLAMGEGEERLLRLYLEDVERWSGRKYEWDVFVRHWETALVDWLRFQASWGFWGNTEWLEGRVRCILRDSEWMDWLRAASE